MDKKDNIRYFIIKADRIKDKIRYIRLYIEILIGICLALVLATYLYPFSKANPEGFQMKFGAFLYHNLDALIVILLTLIVILILLTIIKHFPYDIPFLWTKEEKNTMKEISKAEDLKNEENHYE